MMLINCQAMGMSFEEAKRLNLAQYYMLLAGNAWRDAQSRPARGPHQNGPSREGAVKVDCVGDVMRMAREKGMRVPKKKG